MPTTSNYAFPYPASTAPPQVWVDVQALATAVDTSLAALAQKPIGRTVQIVAQTLTDAVYVPITFTQNDIDTAGQHSISTNTSRVTPNLAGYYRFIGTIWMATATTPVRTSVQFRKSGTALAPTVEDAFNGRQHSTPTAECIVAMNGTTDYVELYGYQDSSGNINTFVSGAASSVLEWEWLRPL